MAAVLGGVAHAAPVALEVRERGTGDPVSGAVVVAQDVEVAVDDAGRARVELPPGAHELTVLAPGWTPEVVRVEVPQGAPVRVFLRPEPAAVEIVVEARAPSPHMSRQVLDRERVEKVPGAFDDPFRLAQSLPGVASTPEYSPTSGALVLRGAAPGESRVFLDGVELPYLYHFQQYASVVHSRLLDELAIYPSAPGPAWGDAIGGIAEVRTRRPDPVRTHGGVNLNTITGGAWVQAPVGERTAVSLSARRSFADLFDSSNDQYTVWPVFWDYLAGVEQALAAGGRIGLTLLGAGDSYGRYVGDTGLLDPVSRAEAPDFRFRRAFHGAILTAELHGAASTHTSTLGLTHDAWGGELPGGRQDRRALQPTARHISRFTVTDHWTLSTGGDGTVTAVQREVAAARPWPELGEEVPLLAHGTDLDDSQTRIRGGVWAEPRWTRGIARIQPGLRLQGDALVGALAVEPRMGLAVQATEILRLYAAGGRTTQAPTVDAVLRSERPLGLMDSWQGVVGTDWAVAGRWEIGLEGWVRAVDNAVVDEVGAPVRTVDGEAGGVELTSRYRLRERFFTYGSVAVGRSLRGGAPADYDQPLIVNLVASWDFAPGWNAGLRYRYASGLPYTPLSGSYDGDTDTWDPVAGAANSARLPNYQKLDAHLEKAWAFRTWTLTGYFEAWWVPSGSNAMYVVHSYDYSQSATVAGPPFLPLVGVRADL
jgi:hypothetical protein